MKKKNRDIAGLSISFVVVLFCLLWQGCAHQFPLPQEARHTVYTVTAAANPVVRKWAPAFLVYGYNDVYNRIGSAAAQQDGTIGIDTDRPTVYVMQRSFVTEKAEYTNIIYRVHFPGVPFSLIPFNLTAGDNVGLMVVVTLNAKHQPVLVTTVHTCGCYRAFVPTSYLPDDALPERWSFDREQNVNGEKLTPQISFANKDDPVLLLELRPELHRVMSVAVAPADQLSGNRYDRVEMAVAPADALQALPMNGESTSFYYSEGWRKGHVKGSIKPLESLFMSLVSLDLFVGSDKIYADPEVSGNRFYTSLKPWRRDDSGMWDFAGFLTYWGWRL